MAVYELSFENNQSGLKNNQRNQMPRGGRRIGSGRKSGGATKKTREIADTAAVRGVKLPLEYMLAVLGDETASQARRDAMAIASAAYCHPKLSAVGLSNHVPGGGGESNVSLDVQIYAVPRGAKFGSDGTITIDGEAVTELPSIEPYSGTPALTDESTPAPFEPPLAVIEVDTSNVTVLRRRSDDDEPDGVA